MAGADLSARENPRGCMQRCLGALAAALLVASSATALEVREAFWGFDGRAVPGRLNPVSVLVENSAPSAFERPLLLHKTDRLGGRIGEEIVEPCYLAPFTSRWVQFHVYVREDEEEWLLSWGSRLNERHALPVARLGPPACVLLQDPESLSKPAPGIKLFPENLFPPSVSATETLHSVVLDHAPHWDAARRQVFMDWTRSGGIVHLVQDGTGKYPVFPDDMSELNASGERKLVGAGLVVRHPAAAREVGQMFLASHGFAMPELKTGENPMTGAAEDLFFESLKSATRPAHNWALIYLLIVVYIILVVPVNYFLGRRWYAGRTRRDYRWTIGFCLAVVVAFGWLFSLVGRRGYGESAAVHTLSYARPLGRGAWDVSQWTNVFVTSGAYYTVTHPCPQNFYSTCSLMETVNGAVQNGRDGKFSVDIPLFSSRAFLHRGTFPGPDLGLKVAEWKGSEMLESFAVQGAIPEEIVEAWAFYQGRGYPMRVSAPEEGRIQITGPGRPAAELFPREDFAFSPYYGRRFGRSDDEEPSIEQRFKEMLRPLMARALGGAEVLRYGFVLPQVSDAVQVFLFAHTPDSLKMTASGLGREDGYVLYHFTFFKPET